MHGYHNSGCMHCEQDVYSPVKWLWLQTFLSADLNGLMQIKQLVALLYSFYCSWVSRYIRIFWSGVVYRWLLQLRSGAKTFQQHHPLYSAAVIQIILHQCISRRCSSHMVCYPCTEWWRISMTMAHMSLVYVKCIKNRCRWQKVNVVVILFL